MCIRDRFNAAMGGGAPDVATFKLSATPMFTNNNLLADLTPYVDAWDKNCLLYTSMFTYTRLLKHPASTNNTGCSHWMPRK